MTKTPSDLKHKVMRVLGPDHPGLLLRVSSATEATRVDIVECLAHTNGDQAIIDLELAGTDDALRDLMRTQYITELKDDKYKVLLDDVNEQTYDQPMMSVLYRIRVVAPNFIGLLRILTEFLLERSINIESHHGTQYQPPRAREIASLQVFTIRIPKALSMELLHKDLKDLAREHGFWELQIALA